MRKHRQLIGCDSRRLNIIIMATDVFLHPRKGVIMSSTIEKISSEIKTLKNAVTYLESLGHEFPALMCNLKRIRASIKMLELNFVDPSEPIES